MIVSTIEALQKESIKMNEQEKMNWWERELTTINCQKGGYVSAGEIGRHVNMSRNTAKRYMEKLIKSNRVVWTYVASRSGSMATVYHVAQ